MKEKKEKRKIKGAKGRFFGKIIALLMVVFMLLSACYTVIYFLVNR